MKKFVKVCGIIVLLLLLTGITLGVIGLATKGPEGIQEIVDSVTGGRVTINLEPLKKFGFLVQDGLDELNSVDYDINDEMKIAAAYAIAGLVSDEELCADYILPAAFDSRVKDAVAKATAEAAIKSGVARI